jgi:glycosyltransferase involved in cell wall biosynthesis
VHINTIPELLLHSDIKVLPSKKDPHPISIMEASLLKKPVIGANKTGMIYEIKHQETGLLFENNNLQSLVEHIEELLENPQLCKIYGNNGYHFIKNKMAPKKTITHLETFYNKITAPTIHL